MGRLVIIGLMLVSSCFGQASQNVVYQTNNNLTLATPVNILGSNNIGQSSHIVAAIFTDVAGKTCGVPTNFNVRLEESNDNGTTWNSVGVPITNAYLDGTGTVTGITTVFGAYSRLRINPVTFDNTNCVLSTSYSGSLYPASINTVLSAEQSNFKSFFNAEAATHAEAIVPITGTRIALYGMSLVNEGATATPFSIAEHTTNCAGPTTGTIFSATAVGLAANSSLIWPTSIVPYYTASGLGTQGVICIVSTGANVVSVHLVYRQE